jgi:hypothetical protein
MPQHGLTFDPNIRCCKFSAHVTHFLSTRAAILQLRFRSHLSTVSFQHLPRIAASLVSFTCRCTYLGFSCSVMIDNRRKFLATFHLSSCHHLIPRFFIFSSAILSDFISFILKERGFLHPVTMHLAVIFGYLNGYCCVSADSRLISLSLPLIHNITWKGGCNVTMTCMYVTCHIRHIRMWSVYM